MRERWHCPAPDCDETRVAWHDLRAHYGAQHFEEAHLADDPDWWDQSLPEDVRQERKALVFEALRLADEFGRTPQSKEMQERGRKAVWTYRNHFGSYYAAMRAVGLDLPSFVHVCAACEQPVPDNKRAKHIVECPARVDHQGVSGDD